MPHDFIHQLRRIGACDEAIEWARIHDSLQSAWDDCDRGDWMLWLAGRISGNPGSDARRKLVLCVCECARLALPHVPESELRPLRAIATAEAWARGSESVTLDDVRGAEAEAQTAACTYASAAAYLAYAYAAADDAYRASAYASASAYAAYVAAAHVAHVAHAAHASASAASYAARRQTLADCAGIVRRHYPEAPGPLEPDHARL